MNGEANHGREQQRPAGIGERVQRARERRGWRLLDLAYKAGVSQSYLSRVERNQSVPGLEIAQRLADALDMPLMELLGEQDAPTEDETLEMLMRRIVEQEGVDPKMAEELTRQLLQYIHLPYEVRHNVYRYAVYLAREEGVLPPASLEMPAEDDTEAQNANPPTPAARRRPAGRSDVAG